MSIPATSSASCSGARRHDAIRSCLRANAGWGRIGPLNVETTIESARVRLPVSLCQIANSKDVGEFLASHNGLRLLKLRTTNSHFATLPVRHRASGVYLHVRLTPPLWVIRFGIIGEMIAWVRSMPSLFAWRVQEVR